jgi:hypothetical protein
MDKIARIKPAERKELFSQTAAKFGYLSEAAVEKDFWVCWMLKNLFESSLRENIIFKGGTSLSKIFKLINRFSEDIDLILNWKGNPVGDPMTKRSNSRQEKFNEELDNWGQKYIEEVILPKIRDFCKNICAVKTDQAGNIVITYPKAFEDTYLRPQILLEIGAKAAWVPHDSYSITSYAAEAYPQVFETAEAVIVATTPERSFWEKVTILHAEANRPESSRIRNRYSRHYYDTVMIARSKFKEKAFADMELLRQVVDFKDKFYHCGWADYQNAKPGNMKLMPSVNSMDDLRKDYSSMKSMIFGDYPSFDDLMDELKQLEEEINSLS